MNKKFEAEYSVLFLLVWLGGAMLSPCARWTSSMMSLGTLEWTGLVLLLSAVVFFYCFASTVFLTRFRQGIKVSPFLVWASIWLFNVFEDLFRSDLKWEIVSISPAVFIYFFLGIGVFIFASVQNGLLNRVFGYAGEEDVCYYKGYVSKDGYEKLVSATKESNWLYRIAGLTTDMRSEQDMLKIKAYSSDRKCLLSFLIKKKDDFAELNLVAFVMNTSIFINSIDSPTWCRDLSNNVVDIVRHKGIELEEKDDLASKREALEYALKRVKPVFSIRQLPEISLPLFVLVILIITLASSYIMKMEASLGVGIVSFILALTAFLYDYRKKR